MLGTAAHKNGALFVHFRFDLFAHGTAEHIGAAQGVARQNLCGLHHLFLIDENAVSFGQNAFEQRVRIFNWHAAIFTIAKERDVIHRARPIERDERNDVAKIGWADSCKRAAHPFRFQLEYAHRIALLEQRIHSRIIPAECIQIRPRGRTAFNQFQRTLNDRERFEAKKVKLHQPGAFDIFHVKLRDRHVRARIAIERHQLIQRAIANDHSCCVRRAVTRQAFQLHCQVQQLADLIFPLILSGQFRHAIQRTIQRPRISGMVGDQLCQPVNLPIAHLQHTACVLEHGPRLHCPERDDLRHMVRAIFLLDIADDFAAPRFAEIDIKVGHGDAFGVQKTFEQQAKLNRVEIGNC